MAWRSGFRPQALRTMALLALGGSPSVALDRLPGDAIPPSESFIRDPDRLAWGESHEGLACALGVERDSVAQGDAFAVHIGLQFDPGRAPAALGMLNDYSRQVGLRFTNVRTGEIVAREPRVFAGVGPRAAAPEDFVPLRERRVTLRKLDIALLTAEGEQIPEGDYSLVAWYASDGNPQTVTGDCGFPSKYTGPWTFWKGRITSAPVPVHIRRADPVQQEVPVNSGFAVRKLDGRTCWGLSNENPVHVQIVRRPGFFLGCRSGSSCVIGDDRFQPIYGGALSSATWDASGGVMCGLTPADEARLAAGEPLAIRSELTIFETSEPPGHLWMPERGDYRVLWQGAIESGLPVRRGAAEEPRR